MAERRWIAYYREGGNDLTNHTDGGEGLVNATDDTRAKLRAYREAEWLDPERRATLLATLRAADRRAKISSALRGRTKTPEHIAKLPQNRPGRTLTAEHKQAISAGLRGRKHRPETIEKLRQLNRGNRYGVGNRSRTGHVQSAEERRRKSETQKGRPKSAEHRERIRAGALRRWARARGGIWEA